MGMQQGSLSRGSLAKLQGSGVLSGVSVGVHSAMLGQTGMVWSVVTMQGEGVTPAELMVPTVFRISTLSKSICRETRRPHWSLGCTQCQQGMGALNCSLIPRLGALQSHPSLTSQRSFSVPCRSVWERRANCCSVLELVGLWGNKGAGIKDGWGGQAEVRQGDPKTLSWSELWRPRDWEFGRGPVWDTGEKKGIAV